MAENVTFLEVNDLKKVVRLKLPENKTEFVIGSGKDADFKLRKHGLNDTHIRLSRRPTSGEWHIQALSGSDFLIDGSQARRTTAPLSLRQGVKLSDNCIIRLNEGEPTLTEKFLSSNSLGGTGIMEYALVVAIPLAIGLSIFAMTRPTTVVEKDTALTCRIDRVSKEAMNYPSGSTYLERVKPKSYYSCVAGVEAVCDFANAYRGSNASDVKYIQRRLCSGSVRKSKNPTEAVQKRITGSIVKLKKDLASTDPNSDAAIEIRRSISRFEDRMEFAHLGCFNCAQDDLTPKQKQACEHADTMVESLTDAREAWGSNQSRRAMEIYEDIRINSNPQCEVHKAAKYKQSEMRQTQPKESRKSKR